MLANALKWPAAHGTQTSGVRSTAQYDPVAHPAAVLHRPGAAVGAGVGLAVGTAVGDAVGDGVGAGEGTGVGADDGAVVGLGVGTGVGASVGASVGRGVHSLWPVRPLVYCAALQLAQLVLPAELAYLSAEHAAHVVTLLLPSAV